MARYQSEAGLQAIRDLIAAAGCGRASLGQLVRHKMVRRTLVRVCGPSAGPVERQAM